MGQTARGNVRWNIVRALFELLYRDRRLYWLASTLPFAGQWRVWQRLVLPRITGHDVLEMGCGIGSLLADLVAAGYTCAAVDRSPQMVAATRDRLRHKGYAHVEAQVLQASAQQLPFAIASFDTVVSTFPTEYIFDRATLSEIARVLRPAGRLIVVLGATLEPKNGLLWPLVGLQTLVYGRQRAGRVGRGNDGSTVEGRASGGAPDAFAERLQLAGFVTTVERVRGPFWVATLYIGQKSALRSAETASTLV